LTLGGTANATTTAALGSYTLPGLANGTYTIVRDSPIFFTFTPGSQSTTVNGVTLPGKFHRTRPRLHRNDHHTAPQTRQQHRHKDATFTVVGDGDGSAHLPLAEERGEVSGATAQVTRLATTTADSGATFPLGSKQHSGNCDELPAATLTVTASTVTPSITTQPTNQTVNGGADATFTVVATVTASAHVPMAEDRSECKRRDSGDPTHAATTTADTGQFRGVVTTRREPWTMRQRRDCDRSDSDSTITTQPANHTVTGGGGGRRHVQRQPATVLHR